MIKVLSPTGNESSREPSKRHGKGELEEREIRKRVANVDIEIEIQL